MNRREAMTGLGAAAAAAAALAGSAEGAARQAEHGHGAHFMECAKVCVACQLQCDSCYRHCAGLVAGGQKEHARTMQFCVDCAELCRMAATLTARQGALSIPGCDACAKACDACAAECEKYPSDAHMAACAKACRACAKACREMIQHLRA
jgi:hypothetical protein